MTSFVAVEHRSEAERNEGRPALRRVPVKLAAGWGGVNDDVAIALFGSIELDASRIAGPNVKRCEAGPQFSKRRMAAPAQRPEAEMDVDDQEVERRYRRTRGLDGSRGGDAMEKRRDPTPPDDLLQLLIRQTSDGSFSPGEVFDRLLNECRASGVDWRVIVESHLPPTVAPADRGAVVITTITILVFTTRFQAREPVWRRASRKASRVYLSKATGKTSAEVEAWINELKGTAAPTR